MPALSTATVPEYDAIDISSLDFWRRSARERDEAFAMLRRERPVTFHPPAQGGLLPLNNGFWAVVRYPDVRTVSLHPELFCSGNGMAMEDAPMQLVEQVASFIVMDDPRHARLRRLVSKAFTPRNIARIEEQIRQQARDIVAEALRDAEFDVVEGISMRLPLATISSMVGIPPERRHEVYDAANVVVGTNDPGLVTPGQELAELAAAVGHLHIIATELARQRRACPESDLMTALVEAEVDNTRLTDEEIAGFFCLLTVAGNDTTRNAISHGIHAFATHPSQWALLRSDPSRHIAPAAEEIVRWATPAIHMRRTATQDTAIAGQRIAAGDNVVMFYASANRDEAVFPDAWTFDITRDPNDHIGYGAGGPHYCLGASLARTQLRAAFTELATRVRHVEADEPEYLVGNLIHGVKHLRCRFDREPSA